MKRYLLSATLLALALGTPMISPAQTVVRETTTTSTVGTISEFGPETIVVRTETATAPVRYTSTKTTTYVDETGAPVTIETVKTGVPVTVHYTKVGDRLVANRVVVRKTVRPAAPVAPTIIEKKTTTTTTTVPARKKDED